MSWRVSTHKLKKEGVQVAYMNPPGGMFTYVSGWWLTRTPRTTTRQLALVDSSLSDEAAHYAFAEIGDGPANVEALAKEPDELFAQLGHRSRRRYVSEDRHFQRRLKNKNEVVNAGPKSAPR